MPQSEYERHIERLHESLGIPASYRSQSPLPLQRVPKTLVATEVDCFGRPQQLTEAAFRAWRAMRQAASEDAVELLLVSAWRSPQYQHDLIARKLARGRGIEQILKVNAAPGYSEHHTGRAIDIGAPDCEVLTESFEDTPAFRWLSSHAKTHGFHMSYPRNNPFGIIYEPWHWCYHHRGERAG